MKKRSLRISATLVVTGLCTAYIVWKIDLRQVLHILTHASLGYFLLALAIMVFAAPHALPGLTIPNGGSGGSMMMG